MVLSRSMHRRARASRRSRLPGLASLLAAMVMAGACSRGGDTGLESGRPDAETDMTAGDESASDAAVGRTGDAETRLVFGDPVDEGFDPVVDVEVDPVPQSAADGPELAEPGDVIPEIAEQLEPGAGGDLLDRVDVVDDGADVATERDGRARNSSGELASLDDAANLACAHVEIAIDHLDGGNGSVAIERLVTAADRARASELPSIQVWAEPLAASVEDGAVADPAPLIGFLSVCAEGGYEL